MTSKLDQSRRVARRLQRVVGAAFASWQMAGQKHRTIHCMGCGATVTASRYARSKFRKSHAETCHGSNAQGHGSVTRKETP